MPKHIEPMLATLATKAFDDDDWLFEIKWDGFRVQAVVDDGKVKIWTRSLKDAEMYFPNLLSPPRWIEAQQAIVDGEVVALDEAGRPDFSLLQTKLGNKTGGGLVYQPFDLLYLDGRSLLQVPLEDRKRLLRSVLKEHPRVRYAAHVEGEGKAFFAAAEANGLEGIIAKLRRSPYEPGKRTPAWLKIKIRPEQELVVGGWTPGSGNAKDLGAVAVGVYEGGKLRFAGKVGSGFTAGIRRELLDRMKPLAQDEPPFDPPPPKDYKGRWGGELNDVTWVRPELVIRAELGGWTRDGVVRQAAYKGIEPGRDPKTVVHETPVSTTSAVRAAESEVPPMPESKTKSAAAGGREGEIDVEVEGEGGRERLGRVPPPRSVAPRPRSWPRSMPSATKASGRSMARTSRSPTSTRCCSSPARPTTSPITKRELIRYYVTIAPTILPHLKDRPLNLNRFPNGPDGPSFWQKNIKETDPKWLTRWHETGVDGRTDRDANDHLIADGPAALAWLANQASFEIHAWTGKLPDPWQPTFAYIDIDPGEKTTWEDTLTLARLYRAALEHLGVRGYPKTTGKRGIQIWIPIEPKYDFHETSSWVERVSRAVGSTVPDLISWEWSTKNRGGKARLDYTQNASIKTLVAPYSVRPAAGAPVSTPITWDELDDPDIRPDRWTIRDLPARVAKVGDLFAAAQTDLQELPPV